MKIKRALPTLSKNFDDYYQESLDRIRQKKVLQEPVFNLLSWLVDAKALLHVDELRQCLPLHDEIDDDTPLDDFDEHVERIVAESEGLVIIQHAYYDHEVHNPLRRPKFSLTRPNSCLRYSVVIAHETIQSYLEQHRAEWYPTSRDPNEFIWTACARFMSLPFCTTRLVQWTKEALRVEDPSTPFSGDNRRFLIWCANYWTRHFASENSQIEPFQETLKYLGERLMRAGRMNEFDPLFCCAMFDWKYLAKSLTDQGANPTAEFNSLTPASVAFTTGREGLGLWLLQLARGQPWGNRGVRAKRSSL